MQKALNLLVKEEKTEVTVMMGMQNAFDVARAAGAAPPPVDSVMATARAEQPMCAAWLHHTAGERWQRRAPEGARRLHQGCGADQLGCSPFHLTPLPRFLVIRCCSGDA